MKMISRIIFFLIFLSQIAFANPTQINLLANNGYQKLIWTMPADLQQTLTNKIKSQGIPNPNTLVLISNGICAKSQNPLICVREYLLNHGASQQTLLFYDRYYGLVDNIKTYGPVMVLHANVYAADHDDGYYLLNNQGLLIDTSDIKLVQSDNINKNPKMTALLKKFPQAWIWTIPTALPEVKTTNNSQSFIFPYYMVNGCHACGNVATAYIAFNFDQNANFQGIKLSKISLIKLS